MRCGPIRRTIADRVGKILPGEFVGKASEKNPQIYQLRRLQFQRS